MMVEFEFYYSHSLFSIFYFLSPILHPLFSKKRKRKFAQNNFFMRTNLVITAFLGALTVILGAFGAHALKETLAPDTLESFNTGVRYQMYHVLALLLANSTAYLPIKFKKWASYLFFIGLLFFSGSIYAITVGGIDAKSIWFITPLGGLLLIGGWLTMLIGFLRGKLKA